MDEFQTFLLSRLSEAGTLIARLDQRVATLEKDRDERERDEKDAARDREHLRPSWVSILIAMVGVIISIASFAINYHHK